MKKVKISTFADKYLLDIIVRRYPGQKNKWSASFERCEIKQGGLLCSSWGTGKSMQGAVLSLVKEIKGQTLVKDAYRESRQEFFVPKNLVP